MITMSNYKSTFKKNISSEYKKKRCDIDIHGSCVSRDIFRFDFDNEVAIGKYFARNSFISAVSESFPEEVDLNIVSDWQKRIVETDLKKELFKKLSDDSAEFLLVDFIDERSGLMKYKNSIFTLSMELQNSNFSDYYKGDLINKFGMDDSIWMKSMDQYIENILNIFHEDRIILHETYFVDSYITKEGEIKPFPEHNLTFNGKVNTILRKYYKYLKIKLPDAYVIDILDNYNLACENHKWGLAPVHYEDDYYKHALNLIKKIIRSK